MEKEKNNSFSAESFKFYGTETKIRLSKFTESFKLYGKETKQYSRNLFTEELTIDPVMADGKM